MKKLISVFVAALMLCSVLTACGGGQGSSEEIAKVTVVIEADGTKIIEKTEVSVEGIDGAAPLAIDAIIAALQENEVEYKTVEFAGTDKLEKIGDYDTENNKYIWELYLNGEDEPAPGRLATVEVSDGDEILVKRNAYESVITESTEETTAEPTKEIATVDDGYEG